MKSHLYLCALFVIPGLASAQAIKSDRPIEPFTAADIAAVDHPDLQFEETQGDRDSYEKYFYFQRDNTTFDRAFADVTECDSLAQGIRVYMGGSEPYPGYYGNQYGVGGAIGGVLGSMMADAIFGSAERRKVRRTNMRRCMGFKGYARYGLEKERWQSFNFEEGNSSVKDDKRRAFLLMQAKVASGMKPKQEVLEP